MKGLEFTSPNDSLGLLLCGKLKRRRRARILIFEALMQIGFNWF